MSDERGGFLAVDSGLVRQTLVEAMFGQVEKVSEERPPEDVDAVLLAEGVNFAGGPDEVALDHGLRHYGYLARAVEADLFEPARAPADWLAPRLAECYARAGNWPQAILEVCDELARAEPVGKPSPDDEAAMSWRVPGPGGHVRHYLARRTIEDHLREREEPLAGDPADLKRAWIYGFFVRACEEVLPEDAELDPAD